MQQKSELPEGWTETPLEHILFSLESGSRPKGGVRGVSEGIPSIGGEHLNDNGGFRFDKIKFVAKEFFEKMNQGIIEVNDILIVKDGATTGKISIVKTDFPYNKAAVNEHVFLCRPYPELSSYYIFYFLFSEIGQKRILNNFRGSAQGGINKSFAPNTIIPLPPLAEQHRIVSAIEALFARLDATNEKLDRVPEILNKFRESVLAAACDGRLTEGWREENPGIENSSLLLKKIKSFRKHVLNSKQQVEEESYGNQNNVANGRYANIPDTWNICQIKDISIVNLGGTPSRKIKSYWNGNINWLSSGEIANCRITSTKEKITEEGLRNSNAKLYPPKTVLIAMIGEGKTRGQSAILDIYSCTNQNVAALLFDTDHISPEYVFRWALGEYKHNRSVGRGGSQPALNGQKVRELIIPLPPLPEQQEIVRRVDSLFTLANSIEAKVAAAREKTEKLRQSILAKAFSGELVETEAEIARREGRDYETAEVLIERIKEERGKGGRNDET